MDKSMVERLFQQTDEDGTGAELDRYLRTRAGEQMYREYLSLYPFAPPRAPEKERIQRIKESLLGRYAGWPFVGQELDNKAAGRIYAAREIQLRPAAASYPARHGVLVFEPCDIWIEEISRGEIVFRIIARTSSAGRAIKIHLREAERTDLLCIVPPLAAGEEIPIELNRKLDLTRLNKNDPAYAVLVDWDER